MRYRSAIKVEGYFDNDDWLTMDNSEVHVWPVVLLLTFGGYDIGRVARTCVFVEVAVYG